MDIGEIAKRAAVRRVVYVLVALALAYVGIGEAHAGISSQTFPSRAAAAAACQQSMDYVLAYNSAHAPVSCTLVENANHSAGQHLYQCTRSGGSFTCGYNSHASAVSSHYFDDVANDGCAAGETWDEATRTCVAEGPTDEECLAINSQPGFIGVGEVTRGFTSQCMANGCIYEAVGQVGTVSVDGVTGSQYYGTYEWTGACASVPPPEAPAPETLENPPPQECFAGTDPLVCIKGNGEHCFAASTGKQICWRPGETGTKTSGDTAQKRVPGSLPATPPTPPEGESFSTGGSATTNTTVGGSTVITTTTNFTTTGGTEAGPDQGEADDGSGNTSSGGGDCDAPPVVSGDAALAMIATQAWHTRCAVEAGNAASVTGDVSDCSQPFTVDGDNANAEQLRALRASICTEVPLEQQSDGTTGGDAADTAVWDTLSVETLLGGLDDSGFVGGSNTCPALPVFNLGSFGTFTPEVPYWCQLLEWLSAFVMFGAAIVSIIILME